MPRAPRCLGALLLFGGLAAQEQVGSIRGVVRDREFAGALAEVQVSLPDLGRQALTSDQGNYVLPEVPAGTYTIVFAKSGYVRFVKSDVVVTGGRLAELDVVLAGDFTDMEEFVVQDVLNLGSDARMNFPGRPAGNWTWRFRADQLTDEVLDRLRDLTVLYSRDTPKFTS